MRLIDSDALVLRINSSKIDESTKEDLKHAIRDWNDGLDCLTIPAKPYTYEILTGPPVRKYYEDDSPRPTNCINCGAPLHGGRCEYCGTEY